MRVGIDELRGTLRRHAQSMEAFAEGYTARSEALDDAPERTALSTSLAKFVRVGIPIVGPTFRLSRRSSFAPLALTKTDPSFTSISISSQFIVRLVPTRPARSTPERSMRTSTRFFDSVSTTLPARILDNTGTRQHEKCLSHACELRSPHQRLNIIKDRYV